MTGNKARAEKVFRIQMLPEKVPLLIEATVFSKIKKINVICVGKSPEIGNQTHLSKCRWRKKYYGIVKIVLNVLTSNG